ncbi:MAG: heme exporter protein CcmB [Gammaproteobacteria bacterium]|jgi:heme exporter protein B
MNGQTSAWYAFSALLRRDLVLGLRYLADLTNPLLLFLIVITLFPLSLGPDKEVLRSFAPAIIWVAAVLASSLSLDAVFRSDYEDGCLEQILLSPYPAVLLAGAKILAHWLLSGAPLILFALLAGVFLYLPEAAIMPLVLTLLLGTPVLSLVGAVAGALTVGLRGSALLQSLIILPLYMPLLIFATAAVNHALAGHSIAGELYFLGAMLALALTLAPFAVASSLRIRLG